MNGHGPAGAAPPGTDRITALARRDAAAAELDAALTRHAGTVEILDLARNFHNAQTEVNRQTTRKLPTYPDHPGPAPHHDGTAQGLADPQRWAHAAVDNIARSDDVATMAEHLAHLTDEDGAPRYPVEKLAAIKNHLFYEAHRLDATADGRTVEGTIDARFEPNADIAEAWLRLRSGRHTHQDTVLLDHEWAEHQYLQQHPKAHHATAHTEANKVANWQVSKPPAGHEDYSHWDGPARQDPRKPEEYGPGERRPTPGQAGGERAENRSSGDPRPEIRFDAEVAARTEIRDSAAERLVSLGRPLGLGSWLDGRELTPELLRSAHDAPAARAFESDAEVAARVDWDHAAEDYLRAHQDLAVLDGALWANRADRVAALRDGLEAQKRSVLAGVAAESQMRDSAVEQLSDLERAYDANLGVVDNYLSYLRRPGSDTLPDLMARRDEALTIRDGYRLAAGEGYRVAFAKAAEAVASADVRRIEDLIAAIADRDKCVVVVLAMFDTHRYVGRLDALAERQAEVGRQEARARAAVEHAAVAAARDGMAEGPQRARLDERYRRLDAELKRLDTRQRLRDEIAAMGPTRLDLPPWVEISGVSGPFGSPSGLRFLIAPYDRYADAVAARAHADPGEEYRRADARADAEAGLIDAAARRQAMQDQPRGLRLRYPGPRRDDAEDRVVFAGSTNRIIDDLMYIYRNINLSGLREKSVDPESVRQLAQEFHDVVARFPILHFLLVQIVPRDHFRMFAGKEDGDRPGNVGHEVSRKHGFVSRIEFGGRCDPRPERECTPRRTGRGTGVPAAGVVARASGRADDPNAG